MLGIRVNTLKIHKRHFYIQLCWTKPNHISWLQMSDKANPDSRHFTGTCYTLRIH